MPREQVEWFAEKMEEKLAINDGKGGWGECSYEYLTQRLLEEIDEVFTAIMTGTNEEIIAECADVANFAMMIADKVKKEDE